MDPFRARARRAARTVPAAAPTAPSDLQRWVDGSARQIAQLQTIDALIARVVPPSVPSGPVASPSQAVPTGGPVVQRYTIRDGHKVSSHETLAIPEKEETQVLYAKRDVIARSNVILEALSSRVQLNEVGPAPEVLKDLHAFEPVPRQQGLNPFDSSECSTVASNITNGQMTHGVFQDPAQTRHLGTQRYEAPLSLHRLAATFGRSSNVTAQNMAQGQIDLDPDDPPRYAFQFRGLKVEEESRKAVGSQLVTLLPDEALTEVIGDILVQYSHMPQLQQEVMDLLEPKLPSIAEYKDKELPLKSKETWKNELSNAIDAARLSERESFQGLSEEERKKRAQQTGVNEYAQPDVGEAFGVVGTRVRSDQEKQEGKFWSYHFAAVVARDGDDAVTLENVNRHGAEKADQRWYFDIHGALEQSFHQKHKATVADGMTLRYGAPVSVADKELLINELAEHDRKEELLKRIDDAVTQADLAAIRAQARGHA